MKKLIAMALSLAVLLNLTACGGGNIGNSENVESSAQDETIESEQAAAAVTSDKEYIEYTLNLANNEEQEWSYSETADAWILSVVSAVAYPESEGQQGVSVCVPGAYVIGIDTDGDGTEDVTADAYTEMVKGSLVIDYEAEVINIC